jgi:uncharacterized protein (TIGR00304 family)
VDLEGFYDLGFALILIGIFIILMAVLLLLFSDARGKGKIRGGGVVIVGPIPVVFGTDKESLRTVLLLSIVLTVTVIVAIVIFHSISG